MLYLIQYVCVCLHVCPSVLPFLFSPAHKELRNSKPLTWPARGLNHRERTKVIKLSPPLLLSAGVQSPEASSFRVPEQSDRGTNPGVISLWPSSNAVSHRST